MILLIAGGIVLAYIVLWLLGLALAIAKEEPGAGCGCLLLLLVGCAALYLALG